MAPGGLLHTSSQSLRRLTSSDSMSSVNSGLTTLDGLTKTNSRKNAGGGVLTICIVIVIAVFVIAQTYWFFTAAQQLITVPQLETDATISVPVCGGCGVRTEDIANIACSLRDNKDTSLPMSEVAAGRTAWGIARPENPWTNWTFQYGCVQIVNRDLLAEYLYTCTMFVERSHVFLDPPVFVILPSLEEIAKSAAQPTVRTLDMIKAANSAPFVRVSPAIDRYFGWTIAAFALRFTTTVAPAVSFMNQVILGETPSAEQTTGPITTDWQYFPVGERRPVSCAGLVTPEVTKLANASDADCINIQYILGGSRFVTTYQSTRSVSVTIGIIGGFAGLVIWCAKICLHGSMYILFRGRGPPDSSSDSTRDPIPLSSIVPLDTE